MDRTGSARWEGNLQDGKGTLRVGSGGFAGAYSWKSRFADGQGTNPEEMIGAAHAACFSMALSGALTKAGFPPRSIETTATVHLGKAGDAPAITVIDLDTKVDAPGISPDVLTKTAEGAKQNCPVSKALAAVPITLKVTDVGEVQTTA